MTCSRAGRTCPPDSPDDGCAGGWPVHCGARGVRPHAAPPPDVLYNNALRDYNSGKYDLSSQEFARLSEVLLQHRSRRKRAVLCRRHRVSARQLRSCGQDYDKVLEQYPGGNKAAAAQLKKGYALLELGQKDAGVRELNSLIAAIRAQLKHRRLAIA